MNPGRTQEPAAGYKYLFGPVASRRLGRSLGVDLVPPKTCTFNCLFCQIGPTPHTTLRRREYVPTSGVLTEFDRWLAEGGTADCITLSGSGEPTLHVGFGDVLAGVTERCTIRTALLTNGSMMHLPEVRAASVNASVVKVSLSAWNDELFHLVNRPDAGLSFNVLLDGLRAFRGEFAGEMWLEVFVLPGINDTMDDMAKIAGLVAGIDPDWVHINTVVRPPADPAAKTASGDSLNRIASLFGPNVEVIASFDAGVDEKDVGIPEDLIIDMVGRRPSTLEDIAGVFGTSIDEVREYLDTMVDSGAIVRSEQSGKVYYLGSKISS